MQHKQILNISLNGIYFEICNICIDVIKFKQLLIQPNSTIKRIYALKYSCVYGNVHNLNTVEIDWLCYVYL